MKTERPEFILRKIKILFISAVLSTGIANSLPRAAQATSALRLPYPVEFGVKPSSTYDVNGKRMGGGNVLIEKTEDGGVRMTVINELDSVSRHTLVAELGPTENGEFLQLLREEGKTTNQQGELIGSKILDHRKGLLECLKGNDLKKSLVVPLPEDDRTILVPGNLLLRPLVHGQEQSIHFQFATCAGIAGRHFINVRGELAKPPAGRFDPDQNVAKVDIQVNLGRILNRIVVPLLPRVSFWFDANTTQWLGHRSPTYADGPTVITVRNETTASALLKGSTLHPATPPVSLKPAYQ
jgi:hypothetical protein